MHPRLFEFGPLHIPGGYTFGPFTIYTYGVLLAAAYLIGLQIALVRGRRRGLDSAHLMDLGIYIIISALVGAKLMLLLLDFNYFWTHPADVLTLIRSGGVFYGGFLMAVGVGIWYVRRHRLPIWETADVFAPGVALGHAIGRVGCLMAGCCFGRPTSAPWAIRFTDTFAAANVGTPLDVDLHPTQIYEAGAELLIFALLLLSERKGRGFAGRTFWLYVLLYSIARFVIEFYRGDPRGMVFGLLSISQFVSVILAPVSIYMLYRLSRPDSPAPARALRRRAA